MTSSKDSFQLDAVYEANLGKTLGVIEELRALLGAEGIKCPGVLVVGAQSAGKSSVLERLTGLSFPRGENLCTRFPTIVQLQTKIDIESSYAFVSNDPEFNDAEQISSMTNITKAIEQCSDKHGEDGTTIADRPIHVRYVRHSGPVMTLIDLPGITHLDPWNKDFNIHAETVKIINEYIQNENMIVLVVIPANDDFGNSEALQIAQTYDKEGKRTIGVISKCDLVPNSSDIVEKIRMVRENDVKLSLGFIAVRNKSPKEKDMDINKEEGKLFSSHSVLKSLNKDEWGYATLSKKIVNLQTAKVNEFIPKARSLIQKKLHDANSQIKTFGSIPSSDSERRTLLSTIMFELQQAIGRLIRAEGKEKDSNLAPLILEMAERFSAGVKESLPSFYSVDYHTHILNKMKSSSGYSLPNFQSDILFRNEINSYFFEENMIEKMRAMIDDISDLMHDVLEKELRKISKLNPFPSLLENIYEKCSERTRKAKERAIKITDLIVHAEQIQLFTLNKEYMSLMNKARSNIRNYENSIFLEEKGTGLVTSLGYNTKTKYFSDQMEALKNKNLDPQDSSFIENYVHCSKGDLLAEAAGDFQISIKVYSDVVMSRLFDIIPMVIKSMLVLDLNTNIHIDIPAQFEDASLAHFFTEEETAHRVRTKLKSRIQIMKEAQKKLRSIQ